MRAAGRQLRGCALPIGVVSPSHRECFSPGSVRLAEVGIALNLGHTKMVVAYTGADLDVDLRSDGLYIDALLNDANPNAIEARTAFLHEGHRGLSIEFTCERERLHDDLRIIDNATVRGVALVKNPSYPTAAELRRKRGGRGRIMPDFVRACSCVDGGCDSVNFTVDAFPRFISSLKSREQDLILHTGRLDAQHAIASVSAGTLALSATDSGALQIDIDPAALETPAGTALVESAQATGPVLRPLIDDAKSEYSDEGNVRVYAMPWIDSLLVKNAQNPTGWEGLELPQPAKRERSRRWVYL